MMIPLLPPMEVEFRHGGGEEEQMQGPEEMFLPGIYSILELLLSRLEQGLACWGCWQEDESAKRYLSDTFWNWQESTKLFLRSDYKVPIPTYVDSVG